MPISARLTIPGLALVIGIAAAPALEAQQTYILRCNLRTERLTVWNFGFGMRFKGATAGFGTRAPMDGECAWSDRGWRADEPKSLMWGNDQWGNDGESRAVFGTLVMDHNNVVVERIWSSGSPPAAALFDMVMGEWDKRGIIEFKVYRDDNVMRVKEARTIGDNRSRWIGPFD